MAAHPREIIVAEQPNGGWGWGRGADAREALRQLRKVMAYKRDPKRYVVWDVPAGCVIDDYGRFTFWPSKNGGDDVPPREIGRVGIPAERSKS